MLKMFLLIMRQKDKGETFMKKMKLLRRDSAQSKQQLKAEIQNVLNLWKVHPGQQIRVCKRQTNIPKSFYTLLLSLTEEQMPVSQTQLSMKLMVWPSNRSAIGSRKALARKEAKFNRDSKLYQKMSIITWDKQLNNLVAKFEIEK